MSRQCVSKWVRRYREEGQAGLEDRSSRPRCSPMRTSREVEELVLRARRVLRAGPARLSAFTGVPERTISRILRRHGMLRLWECDPLTGEPLKSPPGPVIRYERERPGELLHMDVKKLASIPPGGGWKIHGRGKAPAGGAGWTFAHSVVDDYTRLAYSEPLPDEKGTTVAAFTARALNHFRQLGITHIAEIMTDNHWSYTHSRAFASLLAQHDIRHITIKPYHPQQNGKVEDTTKPETKPSTTGSTTTTTTDPTTASEANHQPPDCNQPTGHVQLNPGGQTPQRPRPSQNFPIRSNQPMIPLQRSGDNQL